MRFSRRLFFGLDWAQVKDYAASAVIDTEGDDLPPPNPRHQNRPRYALRGVERFNEKEDGPVAKYAKRGSMPWEERVLEYICAKFLLNKPYHQDTNLILDATGRGLDVYRLFKASPLLQRANPAFYPIEVRPKVRKIIQKENGILIVSRKDLLKRAAVVFDQGRISLPPDIAEEVIRELVMVQAVEEKRSDDDDEASPTNKLRNDDRALAISMALFFAETLADQGVGGIVPVRWER